MIYSLLMFVIVYAVLDALHDYYVIKQSSKKWHNIDAIIRGFVFSTIAISLTMYLPAIESPIDMPNQLVAILVGVYMLSVYWIVFDILINILLGRDILSKGTTSTMDRIPAIPYIMLKFTALFYSIIATHFFA